MKNAVFILGADDPEMRRIVQILEEAKVSAVLFAATDGARVSPGNAYDGNVAINSVGEVTDFSTAKNLVFIECAVPHDAAAHITIIDHHREGDPGHGLGPADYFIASSLGQLLKLLDLQPTPDDLVLAAMDHCYNAAMQGKCPNVSVEAVLERKITEIAGFQKCSTGEVRAVIQHYLDFVLPSPVLTNLVQIGSQDVYVIKEDLGIGYTLSYLAAQVAAVLEGAPVLLRSRDRVGGPSKFHLCGSVTEKTIDHFLKVWALKEGMNPLYGSPKRGYAGGYRHPTPDLAKRAEAFARERHAGLTRPNKAAEPYHVHLAEVAELVRDAVGTLHGLDLIAAAWLHDTVEDTRTTIEEIKEKFGPNVAFLVDGLTDPASFKYHSTYERKKAQAERLKLKSTNVMIVKLADQISNLRSVAHDPPTTWDYEKITAYISGARLIAEVCAEHRSEMSGELLMEFDRASKACLFAYGV